MIYLGLESSRVVDVNTI